jgi:hypothetical protein
MRQLGFVTKEDNVAKDRIKLTPAQKRNIAKAFRKNRAAIDKALQDARRKVMKSHAALQAFLLRTGGEDPKATTDGRP